MLYSTLEPFPSKISETQQSSSAHLCLGYDNTHQSYLKTNVPLVFYPALNSRWRAVRAGS